LIGKANSPINEPPILDFRKVVEDIGFVDLPHLNRKGGQEFIRKLGNRMRDLLPSGGTSLVALHRELQSGSQLRSTEW